MYRIENWINEGSAWKIQYIDGEYINIAIYNPLSRSTYIELLIELKQKTKKGLINIKNNDNKCFLWCHIRHLSSLNKNPQRITKVDKKWFMILIIKILGFLNLKKIIKRLSKVCINVFCSDNGLTYPVHISKQKLKDYMDLLLINDENKSHSVYIKDFNKFMFNKTKNKNKKHFYRYCLQCFSS